MSKQLKIEATIHEHTPGITGDLMSIRVAVIDPDKPLEYLYDKQIMLVTETTRPTKAEMLDNLVKMIKKAKAIQSK